MTKAEFLKNPLSFYHRDREGMRDEWIAEVWEQDANFRQRVSYEFQRYASKLGTLEMMQDDLKLLARVLSLRQIIELYMAIREDSPHRESEFRPTFDAVLGERMAAFPWPLTEGELQEFYGI